MSVADTAASPAAEETRPDAAQTQQTETNQTTDVNTKAEDSSTSEDAGAKPSLFDAVKATLTKPDDTEKSPVSEANNDSKDTAAEADVADEDPDAEDKGEITEEEKKLLSAKTQKRIQKLARQRDELKGPAERTRNLDAFLAGYGIPAEDAKGALELLALMRTKPAEALDRLRGISYELSLQLGETLPTDIKDKVDKGVIDEETGRELAKARAQAGGFKQATETLTAKTRESQEQEFKRQVSHEVTEWEKTVSSRDPDFAKKQPLIEAQFRALIQSGERIGTPSDAARLMKQAYKIVNDSTAPFRDQQRREVKAPPASSTAATKAVPKTHEEAVRLAIMGSAA